MSTTPKKAPENGPKKTPPEFPVWQTALATKIGVGLDDLRELRDAHLQREVDWKIGGNNHVVFTTAAAEKLAVLVMNAQADNKVKLLPPETLTPEDVAMTVHRTWPFITNTRVLEAKLTQDCQHHAAGTIVLVRVRDNRAFRKDMALTARFDQGMTYNLSSRPSRS